MASSSKSYPVEVVGAKLPKLLEKVDPEEISDELFSLKIIDYGLYVSSFDRSISRKNRTRNLIFAVLKAIPNDSSVFSKFCSVLGKSTKPSVQDLGTRLKADFEETFKPTVLQSKENESKLECLKEKLEMLRTSLLQSDKNIESKHSLIKEFVSNYMQQELEMGTNQDVICSSLKSICSVDMLVPVKIHNWCFEEFERLLSEHTSGDVRQPIFDSETLKPLFSKDNVYHALILARVCSFDEEGFQTYLTKTPHIFEELSISDTPKGQDDAGIERYVIARKDKVLFVGFCGEPDLEAWLNKSSFNEGISVQKERIPIWFFVEYLRKDEGHQIIFTGFSFGGLLAMAVHAELWGQSCLGIDDLQAGVACIGFGTPLIQLDEVEKLSDDGGFMKKNTHLFYIEDDVFPRLLQCVDFAKPKERSSPYKLNKLYASTIGGDVVVALSKLQKLHAEYGKTSQGSQKYMESLKIALKAGVSTVQYEPPLYGLIHYIHQNREAYVFSDLTDQTCSDQLQYPTVAIIDTLQANIFKKHSIERYGGLLGQSFLYFDSHGGKYMCPKNISLPNNFASLKPKVIKAKFSRLADEVAVVLEGENLWFCHKLKVGSGGGARLIEAKRQVTTMRSINFNYDPMHYDDLLIEQESTTVEITLYSHFCKPLKCSVEVEKMEDYRISFRQRQLAKLTPSEVITLSLLSVMLERPSEKFVATGRQSKRFNSVRQFLEDAIQIVPVESICHAIVNESEENAWKCAESLIDSGFEPSPSLLFMDSLSQAEMRLTTGIHPSVLRRVQDLVIKKVWDPRSPIISNITTLDNEVIVTAKKGRLQPVLRKTKEGKVAYEQQVIFDDGKPKHHLYSDVVRRAVSHSISIPKPEPKQPTSGGTQSRIILGIRKMIQNISRTSPNKVICGLNIGQLYLSKSEKTSTGLKPPLDFLKLARKKLIELQDKAEKEFASIQCESEDSANQLTAMHNEEMIRAVNEIMSQEVAICLSLLGAFMEHQMKVPFVNSPEKTAHLLRTTHSSSAVGVWTLFSLNMMNFRSLLKSPHEKLIIEVEMYIEGILRESDTSGYSPDRGKYAGKLQFLLLGMIPTVGCNTKYISYSLERQLSELCNKYNIKPSTKVDDLVGGWNATFSESILFHVMVNYRPLLARWLIWSLNIHRLREELASHTTVGIVGLSKSGKSCLVRSLFNQKAISGTTSTQRTTVPFLYNLEGVVDGLSVVDFPGVDDKDKTVVEIANILLRLSQIVILVIDYRRVYTDSACMWLERMDESGIPVLLCLTHADKLYANECLRKYGRNCSNETARRLILHELETLKGKLGSSPNRETVFCSFCVDGDSFLDGEEGRAILANVGIESQQYVGKWLIEKLEYLQQSAIAEKLKIFLNPLTRSEASKTSTTIGHLKSLRSVTVCGESSIEIGGKQAEKKTLEWPGYGLKLTIPAGALLDGTICTVAVKLIAAGDFEIPENAEVVSAFYWIHSSCKFLKPVDLQLKHCARRTSMPLSFIIGRCDQEDLPYKFKKMEGVFRQESREGSISLRSFSILSIIRNFLWQPQDTSSLENLSIQDETYYVFKVFARKLHSQKVWQFDFLFIKDLEPYLTTIDQRYLAGGWVEDNPATSFEFRDEIIDITLPSEQCEEWRIVRKCSKQIKKSHIDRSLENTTQQNCRIAFRWLGNGNPPPIEYPVTLTGTTDHIEVKLMLPIEEECVDAAAITPPQLRECAPISINIENNPVIEVNTKTQ